MELKGLKINFLGDSITEGVGASDPSKCYVSLIAERTGAVCRNYGISGTRIARQKVHREDGNDADFCGRIDSMDPDADVIVIFGGTNDYGHGDAPIGNFMDRTPDTFYGALHYLYSGLLTKYPKAQFLILTPLHRGYEDWQGPNMPVWDPPKVLKTYVDCIRRVAEYYSLPVLDLYANSGIQPAVPILKELYMPDWLHPSDAGHEIVAKKIIKALEML